MQWVLILWTLGNPEMSLLSDPTWETERDCEEAAQVAMETKAWNRWYCVKGNLKEDMPDWIVESIERENEEGR